MPPNNRVLLLGVRFHEGRYHGIPDWPPSPARLFQALVAGAIEGGGISTDDRAAFEWLEALPAPVIAAPATRDGQGFGNFVPNNDSDKHPPYSKKVSKAIKPRLFEAEIPFLYAWTFQDTDADQQRAHRIRDLAERLYQLGRGVDMAWAWGELLDEEETQARLARHRGPVYRPTPGGDRKHELNGPLPGSLNSLELRHSATGNRFDYKIETKREKAKVNVLFSRPPKPRFRSIAYDSPSHHYLFELRTTNPETPFDPQPQEHIFRLVLYLRDAARERLARALPEETARIERVLIGRNATEADKASRVRILPLPSIGHFHADQDIRRVLVEVPVNCPLRPDDLEWAFSGLVLSETTDPDTGEVTQTRLVPAADTAMLRHFGVSSPKSRQAANKSRLWQTVTPAVLPAQAPRKRIAPDHRKGAAERLAGEAQALSAVHQALRHAGVASQVASLRVQRDPFTAKGQPAKPFADNTRFAPEHLWHVEIGFREPVAGPLVIGDGRYMGLGLMAPVQGREGILAYRITEGLASPADPIELARALRRAVMARVQQTLGKREPLPEFFTGHEVTGEPLRRGDHRHLAFIADLPRNRLLIVAPHRLQNRQATSKERNAIKTLDAALDGFSELRAGTAGLLKLLPDSIDPESDPLFAPAKCWESVTEFHPTRHAKRASVTDALKQDLLRETHRRGFPEPTIEVIDSTEGPRGGLSAHLRLSFVASQHGPLLLGRNCHTGGGLFQNAPAVEA
ncbi:MAG: type I-U CRISPR-associated protein Cas5/Cas6 [Candidatus Thiosymbion ectosymbiont of Robbea hypermnestra]|nr:type I-U CRISPR-associated protein Cas5/Cas6 [Candidatus Thiosymbion ectosymbiont of Robbea hypermnestra]